MYLYIVLSGGNKLKVINIAEFQKDLIEWFYREQRILPWRENKDPYRVWVSEIMLQQTKVDTVIPYFNNFMEKFPNLKSLAEAPEEEVLKAWEGLGYYSRARNLQTAVKEVVENYESVVPNTKEEISKLKGVGPYTAGAVLSIAYGVPEPAVDGNVMRVFSRLHCLEDDIAKSSSRKVFEQAVTKLISHEDPSAFNQAIMELGALICTPTSPKCLLCPVNEHCLAYEEGRQLEFPVKSKKVKVTNKDMSVLLLRNEEGKILVQKREEQGLLANLWQFPTEEMILSSISPFEHWKQWALEKTNQPIEAFDYVDSVEHVFSHLRWNMKIYKAQTTNTILTDENLRWIEEDEFEQLPFARVNQIIFNKFFGKNF